MNIYPLLLVSILLQVCTTVRCSKLVAFSYGTGNNDVTRRQMEYARTHDINLRLIDKEAYVAKRNDIVVMRDYLEAEEKDNATIVMFVESGSLFLNSSAEIIRRFLSVNASVVVSAAVKCEPDPSLMESHPIVASNHKRFVGGEGVMGYAVSLLDLLNIEDLRMIDDKRYYFTRVFTSRVLRERYSLVLDSGSAIFQNLADSYEDVTVEHSAQGLGYLHNVRSNTLPVVVLPVNMQVELESLVNYLGRSWDPIRGCQHCSYHRINLNLTDTSLYPLVTVAVFIHQPTPFLEEFFTKLSNLSYPKSKIHLLISSTMHHHDNIVTRYLDAHKYRYSSMENVNSSHNITHIDHRRHAMDQAKISSQYLLIVDSLVHLTKKDTIKDFISYNKTIVAPLVSRRGQLWSNFWGAVNHDDGYYLRSRDYLDIVNGVKRGVWLVGHISDIYLLKTTLLDDVGSVMSPLEQYQPNEVDMIFSGNMRVASMSMTVANEHQYGYLVNADNTTTDHLHNDLWEVFTNPDDWHDKYIHGQYSQVSDPKFRMKNFTQPCTDVFWWPLLSETFCRELIEEIESDGEWSDGSNKDARLEGGYENVPTRDIHMRQVHWEEHWMEVLRRYVYPVQIKLYEGYTDLPRARMNFVVRYRPTEQDRLRPHHDSSSYTLNIALNEPGLEYEGGGAKFNRYDCAVIKSRRGWVLMSPGRVTHLHEGLPTTMGTRYIFVTFVNP